MKAYVLKSTRQHGGLVKSYYARGPKVFDSKLQAWWFKAVRRKWHWRIVEYTVQPPAAPDSAPPRDSEVHASLTLIRLAALRTPTPTRRTPASRSAA